MNTNPPRSETKALSFHGYADCIGIENEVSRVIFTGHGGGRVLEYSFHGRNVIDHDPEQDGWTLADSSPSIDPCGGRFDIGPEKQIKSHPELWLGSWKQQIVNETTVRQESPVDSGLGVQLIRTFQLTPASSRLKCTQSVINHGTEDVLVCFWSRTFAKSGGRCLIPIQGLSSYPKRYITFHEGARIAMLPDDKAVVNRGDFLEIYPPPQSPKLGFDTSKNWFAYFVDDLMFRKSYEVYDDRRYVDLAGMRIALWFEEERIEQEAIGPGELLKPGATHTFSEHWELSDFPTPAPDQALDLTSLDETFKV